MVTSPDPEEAEAIANAIAEVAPGEIANFVEGSSTKIIDHAKIPEKRHTPSYKKNVMVGALLGMVLAVGAVSMGYLLDVRIERAKLLLQGTSFPISEE